MAGQTQGFYEFGAFRLLPAEGLLLRDGQPVPLPPKAVDTLAALVRRHGHVVTKDELMEQIWPDTFVEEANLTQHISTLRKALGDGGEIPAYIVTIPKRGYRFVAPVQAVGAEPPALVLEERTRARVADEGESPERVAARRRALRAAAAAAAIGAALAGYWAWRQSAAPAPIRSLAVLPFQSLGAAGEEDQMILGLGMADALITKLANLSELEVRPTSAVRAYTGAERDPLAAGRALRVEAVLDASLQRAGERLRVNAQLVRVRDGTALWAGGFDEQFTDIFTVQDSLSGQVAEALALRLTREQRQRLAKRYTENVEAYQLYLKGRYFWNKRTPDGFTKAIGYFEQAIEKDPLYALAYTGLADCYNILNNYDLAPATESGPRAKRAAAKALEIDDTLAEAYTSMALALEAYDYDQAGAERAYRRSIALNPNYATAHHWFGLFLVQMGRPEEGLQELARAQELDPLSQIVNVGVAWTHYFARQHDQAIAHAQRSLELAPDFWAMHLVLAWAHEQKEEYGEAEREFKEALELSGGGTLSLTGLGHLYAVSGQRARALEVLNELNLRSRQQYVSPFFRAAIHAGLGEKEKAFDWLEQAFAERAYWLISLKVNPWFDPLRADPRFAALERRIGFAAASAALPAASAARSGSASR